MQNNAQICLRNTKNSQFSLSFPNIVAKSTLLLLLCYLKTQATLPLGTPNFYHTSMVTLKEKHKTQISCYNGTMNIKLLTLGPQNFYHTSMETPEAKHKTQNPKTQISNLMLQWNYEHKTFDTRTTELLPYLNGNPRFKTQNSSRT